MRLARSLFPVRPARPRGRGWRGALFVCALLLTVAAPARAEDGYDLWLRYRPVADSARVREYRSALTHLVLEGDSPTLQAARAELTTGLRGMLGAELPVGRSVLRDGALIVGTRANSPLIAAAVPAAELRAVGDEGYVLRAVRVGGRRAVVVAANSDVGALYGAFALLRRLQTQAGVATLAVTSAPRIRVRMLDHWDNLDRSVERGYAGRSLWEWDSLPAKVSPRYRDYARANASLGINGAALTNVNANAKVLTAEYLPKVAAIANVLRPYGVKVYLTARFSAPIEIGGLKTADPLDPAVRAWWKAKTDEVYGAVPDFGGWLVKANSEGQPGPQDYKRSHADGANMLADAVTPHGGVVMWRAFVYSAETPTDRIKQAYDEFKPLDGQFRSNVLVQVKNGPLDFQPREPFHPLFGAMPKTPLMMEFQITKEYLGQDTHLVFLAPMWKEVLDADTHARGPGSTVARVVDGSVDRQPRTGIAGVANVGDDRNWTGSQFNQANWYAYGRLAWDHALSSRAIAEEWTRATFTNEPAAVARITRMLLGSHETNVNYMTPLGLVHIMATGHHYGPGAWMVDAGRADWTPPYYHRADTLGLGFDRTAKGSDAVSQYAGPVRARWSSRVTTPDELLLWFHRVGWDEQLRSGRTLWDELAHRYQTGVDSVRAMQRDWNAVQPAVDAERFREVRDFLAIQEREARWWRDATLQYFQTFARRPLPAGVERPAHPLEYYKRLRCPADRDRPRCDAI